MGGRTGSGAMARSRMHSICDAVTLLADLISDEDEIPAWCTDLIGGAHTALMMVYGYIEPIAARQGDHR